MQQALIPRAFATMDGSPFIQYVIRCSSILTSSMSDEFTTAFEKLWIAFRTRWCDRTDLNGAIAFTHDRVKIVMFHRVLQIDVQVNRVNGMIDDALHLFEQKAFSCAFTLSPLDNPSDFADHLEHRGFTNPMKGVAMVCDEIAIPTTSESIEIAEPNASQYDLWADVMCRSFDFPGDVGDLGRTVLDSPNIRLYLAYVNGEPAGSTVLYSQFDVGYIDLVGTLPDHRRKGVASALVAHAVADSQSVGNRWTALEVAGDSPAQRIYERLGFRPVYDRPRFIESRTSNIEN